jgi:hypothetical protein
MRPLAVLLFIGLLAPLASPLGQQGSPETLAPVHVLLEERKLADVTPQALALLAEIEVTTGRDSLQTARAIAGRNRTDPVRRAKKNRVTPRSLIPQIGMNSTQSVRGEP